MFQMDANLSIKLLKQPLAYHISIVAFFILQVNLSNDIKSKNSIIAISHYNNVIRQRKD